MARSSFNFILRATFWENQAKSAYLRKWPSSNLLIICLLLKIHVLKEKQKTVLKKSISYLRLWPPKFWWFLRDFPFLIFFVTLELNYRQQYRKNTYIYIWIGWLDGSPQKKKKKSNVPYSASWNATLQNPSKTIFLRYLRVIFFLIWKKCMIFVCFSFYMQ